MVAATAAVSAVVLITVALVLLMAIRLSFFWALYNRGDETGSRTQDARELD